MKSAKLLLATFMVTPLLSLGQLDAIPTKTNNPFLKGKWGFPLQRELKIFHMADFDDDGNKLGRINELDLDLDKTYFVANNFGINLDYCMDWWCEEDDYSGMDWTGRLGFVYGTSLSERLALYGEVGGIYGKERVEQQNNIDKSSHSGYFFEAGLPVYLGGNTYFTPRFNWTHQTTDFDIYKEKKNAFGLNIGLESYVTGSEMMCDHKLGYSLSRAKYNQGNSFINFQSMGNIRFGNIKSQTNNLPAVSEYDFSSLRVGFNYRYYFVDNLALGAKLNVSTRTQEDQNSSYKTTNSSWSFSPRVTYNLPFENIGNNWFVEAGVGFGSNKNKYNNGTVSSEIKFNNFSFGAWTGYNFWFNDRLAFTPQFGYKSETSENKDTDVKTKTRSLAIETGIQYNF
jgi:opacity protein-like surface antigen